MRKKPKAVTENICGKIRAPGPCDPISECLRYSLKVASGKIFLDFFHITSRLMNLIELNYILLKWCKAKSPAFNRKEKKKATSCSVHKWKIHHKLQAGILRNCVLKKLGQLLPITNELFLSVLSVNVLIVEDSYSEQQLRYINKILNRQCFLFYPKHL